MRTLKLNQEAILKINKLANNLYEIEDEKSYQGAFKMEEIKKIRYKLYKKIIMINDEEK